MIFAAMVEYIIWDGAIYSSRKITVSIIDLATKWKIQDVTFLAMPNEDEIQAYLAKAADLCAREYGYFVASI